MRLLKILGYLASTIVIASALILALAGGFYWKQESRWAADRERARLAPGTPIDTPQFHVLAGDQKAYRVDTSSRVLSVNFDGTEFLNPGGDKILPAAADVRSGPMDVEKYTSPGQKSFCGNSIADDVRHNYPDAGKFHSFEKAMILPVTAPPDAYEFFVSKNRSWVARCWSKRTCITLFSGGRWTARLNISWPDLCKVPGMYARLIPIVDPWVK